MSTSTAAARQHFYPTRFKDAARYYTTGRPYYPKLLSRRIAELVGITQRHSVLDIGTGPGFLAIDAAAFAGAVTGLDPSAEMLAQATANAQRAGVAVTFVQGTSYDLGPQFGPLRLTTFGRSFHWTDRAATLLALDALTEAGGAVALVNDRYPEVPENAWRPGFEAVLDSYGKDEIALAKLRNEISHETILLASPFRHLERVSILERRRTPLRHFIDRALSYGKVWHGSPGFSEADLTERFRAVLAPHLGSDGTIVEVVEGQALIARRPAEVPGA
jgi:SAM-dependent methyltransferase